jgi:rubrerythrin
MTHLIFVVIMKQMKQQMYMPEVLRRLATLEERASDLYAHYATLFCEDAEAKSLFVKMKKEEDNHRTQVLLQERLARSSRASASLVSVDMSGVESVLQAIESQLSFHEVDLLAALNFALMLETNGMEASYRTLLTRQNADLVKLAKALSAGDQHHIRKLVTFRESVMQRSRTDSADADSNG